ncbi:helix-turn-helix domain-containing protein [Mesorhizobium helmanticense]|uniref:Insertion element IS150 protein InsJ-like helix-turn-helix domain-containing protein n=1 Tax=Mesorhizobium helmanticense TaxID=1776423 RepID=A0A2T4ILT1_9HYPH|nr:hypothetical protein C9427_30730 [Mesorhizobium helmanticense]
MRVSNARLSIAILCGAESYASAASNSGVDAATVRKWVALYQAHGDAGLSDKHDR